MKTEEEIKKQIEKLEQTEDKSDGLRGFISALKWVVEDADAVL